MVEVAEKVGFEHRVGFGFQDGFHEDGASYAGLVPVVASVTPDEARESDSHTIIVAGSNFAGATSVSFGAEITVDSFVVDSATQITAEITIPLGATLGAYDVSVTTPDGTGTLASSFTILSAIFSLNTPARIGSGYLYPQYGEATYALARNAASQEHFHGSFGIGQRLASSKYYVYRSGLYFSTGSWIPGDANILTAKLRLFGKYDFSTTDFWLHVVDGTVLNGSGSNNGADGLQDEDFGDLLGETQSLGAMYSSSWNLDPYVGPWSEGNEIDLNAAGLALISKTGTTKFGLRSSRDIAENEPTGDERVHADSARLVVTWERTS